MYLNICKAQQPYCKGRCCDNTSIFNDDFGPRLPARIKEELPMVNLIKPLNARTSDGKIHHGWAFSCNNFDKETHLCKDFEHRPLMCRWYICMEAVHILGLVGEPVEDLPW